MIQRIMKGIKQVNPVLQNYYGNLLEQFLPSTLTFFQSVLSLCENKYKILNFSRANYERNVGVLW